MEIRSTPPGPDDFALRVVRLKEEMARQGCGAAIMVPSANLAYFTGFESRQSDRFHSLLVPLEGELGFVTPAFEASQFHGLPGNPEILAFEEHEDAHVLALCFLEGKTGARSRIALDPWTVFDTALRLVESAGGKFSIEVGRPLFEAVRRKKDEREQAIMAEAAGMTHRALETTWSRLFEGMSEMEIAELLSDSFAEVNPTLGGGGLVQIGPSSALPHGTPGSRRLKENDVLLIDCGTRLFNYFSDITRTVVFGRAPEEIRRIHEIVFEAQEAGLKALAPGVPCEEADRAARAVIEKAGYGERFVHRLGHGIGLEGHESPYLVEGNSTLLEAGDIVTVEPGIYLEGAFGLRIEDVAAVTGEGFVVLGGRPKGLREIG